MTKYLKILFLSGMVLTAIVPFGFAQEVLTWNDCLIEAKKNRSDLISAQEIINQSQEDKTIGVAGLYPQIESTLGISRSKSGLQNNKPSSSHSYGVSAAQSIFDAGKKINEINTASEKIRISKIGYRFISAQARFNLRSAFINLTQAQEMMNTAKEIVKIRQDNVELLQLRYSSGREHRGALLTAQANLAQANYDLSRTERNIEYYQHLLSKEMGREEFTPIIAQTDLEIRGIEKIKPDFDALAKQNSLVLQSIAAINIAEYAVKTAYADFLPVIDGQIGAGKSGANLMPRNSQWNAGINISMPVFDGGLRIAELAKAKSEYKKAQADLRGLRSSIAINLQQSWAALQDSIEMVEVKSKILEAALERSKIAQAQYSIGFITFDNWIIIENDLVNAKLAYLNARINVLLAQASWIQAKGETLEYAEP